MPSRSNYQYGTIVDEALRDTLDEPVPPEDLYTDADRVDGERRVLGGSDVNVSARSNPTQRPASKPALEDSVDPEDLQKSQDYRAPKPDYSQPYDPAEFQRKAMDLRNELGGASVNTSLGRDATAPAPQQKDRQDLADLMARYEKAVRESADRRASIGALATSMNLSVPGSGDDYMKAQQGYINAPLESEVGRLKQAGTGLNLNKDIISQYALDEDNDPASMSSKVARDIAKKYGILDPENATATAAQIKRVAPFVTTEIKGQQSQRQTETKIEGELNKTNIKEAGSTERQKMKDATQKMLRGMDNATKIKVAEMLIRGGFDKMVVQEALEAEQKQTTGGAGGAGGAGSAAALNRADRSLVANIFPTGKQDEMWRLKPGHPVPSVGERNQIAQQQKWTLIIDEYAKELQKAAADLRSGKSPIESYARLQSISGSTKQAIVKGWLNGVANGKDIENATDQLGSYDSFIKFISGYDPAKTETLRQSNKDKFNKIMQIDFELGPANPDEVKVDRTGSGAGGGSTQGASGPVFTAQDAANEVLGRYGYQGTRQFQPGTSSGAAQQQTPPIPSQQQQAPPAQEERVVVIDIASGKRMSLRPSVAEAAIKSGRARKP